MKTNDEKWLVDQLDKHANGQETELPDGLAQVSSSLQQTMRDMQPRPGFVNELAGQLDKQRATSRSTQRIGLPPWFRRLLARAAAGAALITFVWFVSTLFSRPPLTASPTSEPDPLPAALPDANVSPTPLPASLSLTDPGWIHTVEQVTDGSMATVDEQSGDIVTLQTGFRLDVWSLLDEQGRVISRISQVHDLDGNLLQVNTLRDGLSRNLTFGQQIPVESEPLPLAWADPDNPLHQDPSRQLLLIERAAAPPPEVLALLEQEIASNACAGLTLVDEAAWDVRDRYNSWVDTLAEEIGGQPDRWLHVQLERQQNPDAVIHKDSPLPHDYQSEQWIRLDEMGRVVGRVGIIVDGEGQTFSSGVRRDGIAYNFSNQERHPYTPQRLDLDSGFFANMNTLLDAGGSLARAEDQMSGQPALQFSFCQSYNGARPRFGDLPNPIEGDQWHLWLDAVTGQPLRAGRSYADTTDHVHVDWTEDITVEIVDGLPPQAEALWQQAAQSDPVALSSTPTPPTVPHTYPGITLTFQNASYEAHQTTISLTLTISSGSGPEARGASQGQMLLFDDAGNQYRPTLGNARSENTPDGLVTEIIQAFEPGLLPEAQRLTLQTGILLHWATVEPIILDLRGRQPGDRWPVNQTVEIYGIELPIEEAALLSDPDAPPGSLTIQLFAPCVQENGVQFNYLELLVSEGQDISRGPGDTNCWQDEHLVASITVESLLDGRPPSTLQTATLHLVAQLELTGPWEFTWDVPNR